MRSQGSIPPCWGSASIRVPLTRMKLGLTNEAYRLENSDSANNFPATHGVQITRTLIVPVHRSVPGALERDDKIPRDWPEAEHGPSSRTPDVVQAWQRLGPGRGLRRTETKS
jgi:hypothetical protein